MGLQFFKNCLGLLPFGMQEIIPNLWETGTSFLKKYIRLIAITINYQIFPEKFQKTQQ